MTPNHSPFQRQLFQRCWLAALALLLTLQLSACGWPSHADGSVSQQVLLERLETQPLDQHSATSPSLSPASSQPPQQTASSQSWLLLDVRSLQEYAEGHIPGAINIDHRELDNRLAELQAFRQKPVIVYCERGVRASRAEKILNQAGFSQVQQLKGHMSAWRKQNLPTAAVTTRSSPGLGWIVDATQAKQWVAAGATLIDAQGQGRHPRLQGAVTVHWDQFTPDDSVSRGSLLRDDQQLEAKLRAIGVDNDRPVVVFANPSKGWGEAGRIVWMLRTLGHRQAVLVDGGVSALKQTGMTAGRGRSPEPASGQTPEQAPGNFTVARREDWTISAEELRSQLLSDHPPILIDTREPREYNGQTPYGEQRGGHLPGAVHLYFKELLDRQGHLLPAEEIHEKLATLGIQPDSTIVAYCTGGIRSGWLTVVLTDLGYRVQNYAGSMWEWSAGDSDRYPLTQS